MSKHSYPSHRERILGHIDLIGANASPVPEAIIGFTDTTAAVSAIAAHFPYWQHSKVHASWASTGTASARLAKLCRIAHRYGFMKCFTITVSTARLVGPPGLEPGTKGL